MTFWNLIWVLYTLQVCGNFRWHVCFCRTLKCSMMLSGYKTVLIIHFKQWIIDFTVDLLSRTLSVWLSGLVTYPGRPFIPHNSNISKKRRGRSWELEWSCPWKNLCSEQACLQYLPTFLFRFPSSHGSAQVIRVWLLQVYLISLSCW